MEVIEGIEFFFPLVEGWWYRESFFILNRKKELLAWTKTNYHVDITCCIFPSVLVISCFSAGCLASVNTLSSSVHVIAGVRVTGALFLLFIFLLTAWVPAVVHSLLIMFSFIYFLDLPLPFTRILWSVCVCGSRILLLNMLLFLPLTVFCVYVLHCFCTAVWDSRKCCLCILCP